MYFIGILLTSILSFNLIFLILLYIKDRSHSIDTIERGMRYLQDKQQKNDQFMLKLFQENKKGDLQDSRIFREELTSSLHQFGNAIMSRMSENALLQKNQLFDFAESLKNLTELNERQMDKIYSILEKKLKEIQEDNTNKLEKMRETVDEKLNSTLERRLGESFKIVSDRLEKVQRGLGEMQELANGVGDLKKVLNNVKTRGILGEIQLLNLLEQILTKNQYMENVITKPNSTMRVEFAVKIPSKEKNKFILLPIDSKFPLDQYYKLLDAIETNDKTKISIASKSLNTSIKSFAKDICDKYLSPPETTDFGLMFLPIEGLYSEVVRNTVLFEELQNKYHIIITGPSTLAALLNSLQMGFRTLAIERRSSEVWELLGAVKTQFSKFGDLLDKTQKKLDQASKSIEEASKKSRFIEKKLVDVQNLPDSKAESLLEVEQANGSLEAEDSYE